MPRGKKDGDKLAGKKTPAKKPATKAAAKSTAAPAKTRGPESGPRMNKAAVDAKKADAEKILRDAGEAGALAGSVAQKIGLSRPHAVRVLKALAADGRATKPTVTGKGALWRISA